jgi:hypothetical protein
MPIQIPKSSLIPSWITEPSVMDSTPKRMAGSFIRMLGLDDPTSTLPTPTAMGTMVGTEVAKKVAPKRAAMELVDLLLGRSKRAAPKLAPLSDHEAKIVAGQSGFIGSPPPKPTMISIPTGDPIFKPMQRTLPRSDDVYNAYVASRRLEGKKPTSRRVEVGSAFRPRGVAGSTSAPMAKRPIQSTPARTEIKLEQFRDTVKQNGSLHDAAVKQRVKVYTEKEINSMLQGPLQAVERGLMTPAEAEKIIAANRNKIYGLQGGLENLDQRMYNRKMEDALLQRTNRKK